MDDTTRTRAVKLVKPSPVRKKSPVVAAALRDEGLPESMRNYYRKIEHYAGQIRKTDDVGEIIEILDHALLETRALQVNEQVRAAWEKVKRAEEKIEELRREMEQLRELVHTDPLTGALNRSGFDQAFGREAARADRNGSAFCLCLLDLDDFKKINDTCGHQAGDHVLQHLVSVARQALRPHDVIARVGGEEFAILLPDTTIEAAASAIHRLQRNLSANCFRHAGRELPVTFSAGVTPRAPHETQYAVISRADEALYEAKHSGKNRVVQAPW
jgi:diguanylate cyclase